MQEGCEVAKFLCRSKEQRARERRGDESFQSLARNPAALPEAAQAIECSSRMVAG